MKSSGLSAIIIIIFLVAAAKVAGDPPAKGCPVVGYSVIAGKNAGNQTRYLHDAAGKIYQINYYELGDDTFSSYATLCYNKEGQLIRMEEFDRPGREARSLALFAYENGRVARVSRAERSPRKWAIAYDIAYDQYGNISRMTADKTAMIRHPNVFSGSFMDFVWKDGNVISFKVDVDDATLSVAVSYDDRPNIYRHLVNTEGVFGVLLAATKNNTLRWVVSEDASTGSDFISPGITVLDRSYKYFSDSEVGYIVNHRSLLLDIEQETIYEKDCSVEKDLFILLPETEIAMDTANSKLTLKEGYKFKRNVKLFYDTGLERYNLNIMKESSSLDISEVEPAIYYVELTDGKKDYRARFIKY